MELPRNVPSKMLELSDVYMYEGDVIKDKWGKTSKNNNERISQDIDNFNNVALQYGDRVDIYCKRDRDKHFINAIESGFMPKGLKVVMHIKYIE